VIFVVYFAGKLGDDADAMDTTERLRGWGGMAKQVCHCTQTVWSSWVKYLEPLSLFGA
jgi:hypothetical protein